MLDSPGVCGQTIDRYQIESLIEAGGFGAVYRGRHIHTQRAVAVKVLSRELAADTAMLVRFKREAQTMAAIESPHVVQVLDWGVLAGGEAYLVMELLSGHDLRTELRQRGGKLPLEQALAIERQILAGLGAAHARGIVHRDLKPGNVYLTRPETGVNVKLIDFGISKLRPTPGTPDPFRTETNRTFGTPGYMAPEQVRALDTDERADVFAAGVVLYEMLSGQLPHPSASYEDYVIKVCTEDPKPLRELVPDLPPAIDRAVMRALATAPTERWSSVDELGDALDGKVFEPGTRAMRKATPPAATDAPTTPRITGAETTPMRPSQDARTTLSAAASAAMSSRTQARRWPWLAAIGAVAIAGGIIAIVATRSGEQTGVPAMAPATQSAPPAAAPPAPPPPAPAVEPPPPPVVTTTGSGSAVPPAKPKKHSPSDHSPKGAPIDTDLGGSPK
jgi:serine/threonine protein kinase